MNRRNILVMVMGAILISLSACSPKLTPFTQRMYDDFGWNESDLQSIQFYLSDDIVLKRDRGTDGSRIKDGKIRVVDDREVEKIVFKKGTPGVMLFTPRDNRFAISFDDDDRYLMFGPNKKKGGRYVLLAKDWNKRYGKVSYGDQKYITDSESAFATILVDIKKANKVKYTSKHADGRRVGGE